MRRKIIFTLLRIGRIFLGLENKRRRKKEANIWDMRYRRTSNMRKK